MRKVSATESKGIKEETPPTAEKEAIGYVEAPRTKTPKGNAKERCKTPDSPEGAHQATTPHSPTQSSPPPRINPISPPNNGSADSLTPPPPSVQATTVLPVSVETPRNFSDQQYGFSAYPGRQLAKVKKFLSTLVQFGTDINQDVGERVKSLVLNLVSSNLSIEEFHHSLQDVTNFPLRPFVLPFLRTHMPILQRELHTLARVNKQSPLQYVRSHDHVVLDSTSNSLSEAAEIFMPNDLTPLSGIKRRSSEAGLYENGLNGTSCHPSETLDYVPPVKRPTNNPQNHPFLFTHNLTQPNFFLPTVNSGHLFEYSQNNNNNTHTGIKMEENGVNRGDEEWKNIHVMLNCILSMVEKTKRALTILQQRNSPAQDPTSEWLRKQDVSVDLKKAANEILAQAVRQTEERVAEVRRRAEDAVNDVKRQAVVELQKAVAAAEAKAGELVAIERAKMEKLLVDARKPPEDSSNDFPENRESPSSQPAPSQQNSCWNCGRKAHDTCSGCSLARYCGSFCQHKDWENHHQVCSKEKRPTLAPILAHTNPTLSPATVGGNTATVTNQASDRTKK